MSIFGLGKKSPEDERLEEWERHHDDPRSDAGFELFSRAMSNPDLTADELQEMWQEANRLVGKRAPADYGEFLAYGYIEGRRDAIRMALHRTVTKV